MLWNTTVLSLFVYFVSQRLHPAIPTFAEFLEILFLKIRVVSRHSYCYGRLRLPTLIGTIMFSGHMHLHKGYATMSPSLVLHPLLCCYQFEVVWWHVATSGQTTLYMMGGERWVI